jgi:hypothetical protein
MNEPLPAYPVFIRKPEKSNAGLIITLIIITIMAIVIAVIIYQVFKVRNTRTIARCEHGLCVINLLTGEKRGKDSETERLAYLQGTEDCTSKSYCQSNRAPCAVLAGGVLDCDGVCGPGNPQCRCEKSPF